MHDAQHGSCLPLPVSLSVGVLLPSLAKQQFESVTPRAFAPSVTSAEGAGV